MERSSTSKRNVRRSSGCVNWRMTDVVIWTTTPWTIPQNRAVAFNPDISYGLFEVKAVAEGSSAKPGDKLVLALARAEEVFGSAKVLEWNEVRGVSAEELAGLVLAHPFRGVEGAAGEWDYDVPMLPGDHVTDDAGTGFVHTAPSHGDDDYAARPEVRPADDLQRRARRQLSRRSAPVRRPGDHPPEGKEGPANVSVIKQLAYAGALLAKGKLRHSYPHSWRSKAPLIYRNTPQWFAAIDKPIDDGQGAHGATIRDRALTSIRELVTFTPETGKNRLYSMIEARPDWVLSRQRAWGVPLTCFVKRGTRPDAPDFLLRNPQVNARIVAAFEAEGADVWYVQGFKEKMLQGIVNPQDYDQVMDVLDVWFDSAPPMPSCCATGRMARRTAGRPVP
jgi:isoleucyl-tRNA synthetase